MSINSDISDENKFNIQILSNNSLLESIYEDIIGITLNNTFVENLQQIDYNFTYTKITGDSYYYTFFPINPIDGYRNITFTPMPPDIYVD